MFEVKVLDNDYTKCITTQKLIEEVASENGITIELEKVEDAAKIMSTPEIIVNGKTVHTGNTPDKKTILSWFKSLCCPTDDNCC